MAVLKNHPALEAGQVSKSSLEIVVLHTKQKETASALKMAADLASGLAPVRLLAIQQVPRPRLVAARIRWSMTMATSSWVKFDWSYPRTQP